MSLYTLALFAHIVCAMGIVTTLGILYLVATQLRHSTTSGEGQRWLRLAQRANVILAVLGGLILLPAIYMVSSSWSWTDRWIDVAGVGFLVLLVLCAGPVQTALTRLERQVQASSTATPLPAFGLWVALDLVAGDLLGMVYVMTNKPDGTIAAGAIGVGLLLGALVAVLWHRPRAAAQTQHASL